MNDWTNASSNGNHNLRIGVIGLGRRSQLARHAHRPDEGCRIIAGADVHRNAIERFAADYPDAATYEDYRVLIEEAQPDAVVITSPDYLHEAQAIAALERGIAVYLEKPMAITIQGCDRVLDAARRGQAKLYMGHNMRHMPFVREMKRLTDSGAIGQVKAAWGRHFVAYGGDSYFKDWHAERRYVNSLLLQKGVHDIDVLHWLCGGYTTSVVGMGGLTLYDQVKNRRSDQEAGDPSHSDEHWPPLTQRGLNPKLDVEDVNHLLMRLDNGVLVTYQQCHYTPDAWRNYTIIGTEGRIENIGDEPGNCQIRIWNKRTGFNERGDERIDIPAVDGGHGGADPLIIDEFLQYVRYGKPTTTDPLAARAAVAAGVLGAESIRSGGATMQVPPVAFKGTTPAAIKV